MRLVDSWTESFLQGLELINLLRKLCTDVETSACFDKLQLEMGLC